MRVVINVCFGGFSISKEAGEFMAAHGNERAIAELAESKDDWYGFYFDRDNPDLIAAVEELGERANGFAAKLKIVEIPDGIEWEIDEYDGMESIEEKHRSWY
jgi:hypothetical protein